MRYVGCNTITLYERSEKDLDELLATSITTTLMANTCNLLKCDIVA
nr:12993_t:CDS:2 [Entrophospora candida]